MRVKEFKFTKDQNSLPEPQRLGLPSLSFPAGTEHTPQPLVPWTLSPMILQLIPDKQQLWRLCRAILKSSSPTPWDCLTSRSLLMPSIVWATLLTTISPFLPELQSTVPQNKDSMLMGPPTDSCKTCVLLLSHISMFPADMIANLPLFQDPSPYPPPTFNLLRWTWTPIGVSISSHWPSYF